MRTLTSGRFRLLLDYHRITCRDEQASVSEGPTAVRRSHDIVEHYLYGLHNGIIPRDREAFCALLLNARHLVIAFHVISIGSLNSATVHPREVFRPAIAAGAAAMVVAHHHPSGDVSPSPEDRKITERLIAAGELLGIQVLDHVIVTLQRHYSFSDGCHRANPSIQRRDLS